jgi:hypothetical protein
MSHHEHEHHVHAEKNECCGGGCCGDENTSALKAWIVLQWVFLGGAFVCSLLSLVLLPSLIKKHIVAEQAIKAGGISNYERINREIYETPEYKERMKAEVENFIQQSKLQMEMMKQQEQQGQQGQQIDPSAIMPAEGETAQPEAPADVKEPTNNPAQ